jgi:AraC family transcriptional regulator, regulatory protein of adaptative response / methylated-DNA-[protein]-cysteine methyltransferase
MMVIYYTSHTTRLGLAIMAATERGICFLQFDDTVADMLTALHKAFPCASISPVTNHVRPLFSNFFSALNDYFDHKKTLGAVELDIHGTLFQKRVWDYLRAIPFGETRTYAQVACGIDHPNAFRAVGSACGKNLIAIIIPCHRVLASNGKLGGYRWGIERKKRLLNCEQ